MICFPTLQPDEIFYSACARYARLMGDSSTRQPHLDLFGVARGSTGFDIPNRLDAFLARLPTGHPYTAASLIDEHTMLPYHRCWLTPEREQRIAAAMRGDVSEGVSHPRMLTNVGPSVVYPTHLQFCRECLEEDELRPGGLPYWHRVHQLPGVFVCPEHGTRLFMTEHPRRNRPNALAYVPLTRRSLHHARSVELPAARPNVLATLASYTAGLLVSGSTRRAQPLLQHGMRRAVALAGWFRFHGPARPNGQLNASAFSAALSSRCGEALLAAVGCGLPRPSAPGSSWITTLLLTNRGRQPVAGMHPLKVLLACVALGVSPDDLDQLGAMSDAEFAVHLEQRRRAHRAPARVPSRPRGARLGEVGPEWFTQLHTLASDPTTNLAAIARRLGAHPMTIKRHASKLGIARPEWGAPRGPRRPRSGPPRDGLSVDTLDRRGRVLAAMHEHPAAGRAKLRLLTGKDIPRLAETDCAWLDEHLPPRRIVRNGGPHVDWRARDAMRCAEVAPVVARMRADPGGPRITQHRIFTALGLDQSPATVRYHVRTLEAIGAAVEPRDQYCRRRLGHAAQEIGRLGLTLSRSRLITLAGLTGRATEVRDLVDEVYESARASAVMP